MSSDEKKEDVPQADKEPEKPAEAPAVKEVKPEETVNEVKAEKNEDKPVSEETKEATEAAEGFRLRPDAKEWTPKAAPQQHKKHNKHEGYTQQQPHKLPNSSVLPPMNPVAAHQYLMLQKQQQMMAQIAQHQRMQRMAQPMAVEALVRQAQAAQYAQALRQQQQQLEIRRLSQQLQQQNLLHRQLQQQQQATLPTSPEALRALRELQMRKLQLQMQTQQQQQLHALQQLQSMRAAQAAPAAPSPAPTSSSGPAIIKIAGGKSVNFDELKPGSSVLGNMSNSEDTKLMSALKRLTGRPLNYLVFEQRAPRPNDPFRAAMQFVVKPLYSGTVTRFDELSVQELNAFHQDLCSVLKALKKPKSLHMEFGKWNWHDEPFMYVTCWDHQAEVVSLDPTVRPNDLPVDRKHPNDSLRYITKLVCEDDKLKCFRSSCFVDALGSGGDLRKLYTMFQDMFHELPGYEVQVHNLVSDRVEFVVKTQAPLPNNGHLSTTTGTIIDWNALPSSAEPRVQQEPLQGMLGLRKRTA
eukprot:TRINITY_DN3699_c0_g1_i9.p1 TRINITY_DN3699_c0_g1~~TRINITY_DN3699_c0_g1_i9.p1  ORF type:complete len:523 (+),score=167.76 TRINITY_DN3699_c0_g1_i9:73-1641(+)